MEKSRDFLTGIVFFALLGTLGFFTIVLADVKFGELPSRTVLFDAIEGLEPGHAVRIDGVRCGRVKDILRPAGERKIHVVMEFEDEPTLFEGATFTIESASMLGGRVMEIENPTNATVSMAADAMPPGRIAGDPLAQAGKLLSDDNIARVEAILADIQTSVAEIREFAPKLDEKGTELLDSLNASAGKMESFAEELGTKGPDILTKLDARLGEIELFTVALGETGPGILAKLEARIDEIEGFTTTLKNDGPAILSETRDMVADLRGMTAKISSGQGVGRVLLRDDPWIKFESAVAKVEMAAENVAIATGSLRRDDNVVGLLLTDPEMAMQLKRAMKALNDFLETQREDAPLTSFAGLLLTPF